MNGNLAYQEEPWEELLDGKIIAMSPRPAVNHNRVAGNVFWIFRTYLNKRKCVPFDDGTDLYLTDKDRFVPDMMVVCDRNKIKWNGVHGAPDLVVEVLSPSTAKNDRGHKMRVYAKCGIREYWIVDPANRSVEQYFLDGEHFTLNAVYTDYPDYMLEAMSEDERTAVITEFKCSLYDDLIISLDDIFSDLI